MRISSIKLTNFRRFANLEIKNIPPTAKLVVLAGPNGTGKSSLFDALLRRYRNEDRTYYKRLDEPESNPGDDIVIQFHKDQQLTRGAVYVRTAYRHDPEFSTNSLSHQLPILDDLPVHRLIEADATVARNYQRLASQAMNDVFVNEDASTTMGDYRDKMIGKIREPMKRLFPDLSLVGIGNPLEQGSFQFDKGLIKNFDYRNLSGGERAAFDLILDLVVKRDSYPSAVYCIDEPETHISTKTQGVLLQEILDLVPQNSQLWIATHSIGMMRKARDIYDKNSDSVAFLDFSEHDFDKPTLITPKKPTRKFWQNVLHIALDDLATLVVPRTVVICEGNPITPSPGKNPEHDARIYAKIFAEEFPDVQFLSAGDSKKVCNDFLGLACSLQKIAKGIKLIRLIDLDDHAPEDVESHKEKGITVLTRRHLESYLFDDEVLTALCNDNNRADAIEDVLNAKKKAIEESINRNNPSDDIKSAAAKIHTEAKRILGLTQSGNDHLSFALNTLAPLVKSDMQVYQNLKHAIFGS